VLFSFQKHFFFQIIFNHDMAATPSLFKAVPDHSRQCIPGMVVHWSKPRDRWCHTGKRKGRLAAPL